VLTIRRHAPSACPSQSKTLIDVSNGQLSAIAPFAEITCLHHQRQWS
jgi:hypothetical protein